MRSWWRLKMANPTVDRSHCYECGKEGVAYGSLYPLEPVLGAGVGLVNRGEGHEHFPPMRFNADFNVCGPCYLEQRHRRYPEEPEPMRVHMDMEIAGVRAKYQAAQELAWAYQIIAKHQKGG